MAIKNVNTIDESRSKIARNRVFDCHLSPDCKLFIVALVSDWFGYIFSRPINTSDRRQLKMLILSTNVDLRSLEIEFLIAVCCLTGNKWQSKTLFLAICDPHSSIFSECFQLPPVQYDKGAYFMVIEIVWSFLHKTLATIYLNLQRMSLSRLKWQ